MEIGPNNELANAEQIFYDTVREYVISFLVFVILNSISYAVVYSYRRRKDEISSDDEDATVYRISRWLCTFTLSVSLGAVLLLPMSILSNEILVMYPNSYYIKWLNGSLIHGMWNQIFLGSYISLFVSMPFAYFITESEGFAGSRKGIMARVYETSVVLCLLAVLISSIVWVVSALLDKKWSTNPSLADPAGAWIPGLPFIYSCISLLGGLMLLICTPVGFARMFTVLGQYVVKPQFLRDLDDEIQAIQMEEESLKRKLNGFKNGLTGANGKTQDHGDLQKLKVLESERLELERQSKASALQRNCIYPISLLILLLLTTSLMAMVALNFLAVLFVDGSLPRRATVLVLGKVSSSMMGTFGALLEIVLIFYLMLASLVGLYSVPWFVRLRPVPKDTPMTKVIANCIVLLILSSALPVLSRTLGITNFDLMGEFGRLDWLGNIRVIIIYNVWFEVATAFCLVNKFTAAVRNALFEQVRLPALMFTQRLRDKAKKSP
ncbi:limb region 1 protein homolog [Nematostella vectensis]|uniref:limb region 1 protein homolog n=1 Tax=Nematostella vectensis TaxID=45351 RepID=UPI00138FF26D|nr:limb region 1 protein homolog [Nematostella vectensis]